MLEYVARLKYVRKCIIDTAVQKKLGYWRVLFRHFTGLMDGGVYGLNSMLPTVLVLGYT